jgi:hypothetical protein
MFILLILGVSLILALVRGGRLDQLALLQIRWRGVILTGFLIQVLVFSEFWQAQSELRAMTPFAYILSLGLLLAALAANIRLPGLALITLGFCLNLLVIALNGGYMPSSESARALGGLSHLEPGQITSNSVANGPDTRLAFLGDIFAIPRGFLFPNVFSLGDVLIAVGAFYLIQRAMVRPAPRLPS